MAKPNPSNAASVSTPQLDSPKQQRHPSLQLTKRVGGSTRSLPANATTTRINIASDGSTLAPAEDLEPDRASPAKTTDKEASNDNSGVDTGNSEEPQSDTTGEPASSGNAITAVSQPSGWFSWVYTPFATDKPTPSEPTANPTPKQPPEPESSALDQPLQETTRDPSLKDLNKPSEVTEVAPASQKRSWLQMWYGSSSSKGPEEPKDEPSGNAEDQNRPTPAASPGPQEEQDTTKTDSGSATPTSTGNRASAWSFFFRDSGKDSIQGKPQEAQATEVTISRDVPPEQVASGPVTKTGQKPQIINKGSVKISAFPSGVSGPDTAVSQLPNAPEGPAPAPAPAAPEASKQLQKIIPNQVLPYFKDTFAFQDRPTLLQSIGRFLHYNKEANNQHVYKVPHPPRIKRALAIGIHGYFPAPLIRSVLGQPTGTSVRFSNMAAEAIRKYTEDNGYTCEIEKIALEGEGRITERVDLLWKLLLNWMEEIRRADFILVACHSQGVPVGIMLVAKLIAFGCVNANRVGICAMAGVNLGPFTDYRSRWISGSAGELFEFALPYSQVSKGYESALRTCIDFGVRISYVGSIDDQLVSLEVFRPITLQ